MPNKALVQEQLKIFNIPRSSYYYTPKPMKDEDKKILDAMDATLACDVLSEALSKYPAPKIFNSDQGSQYTSNQHIEILKEYNIQISMNGKARSIHNIAIERFFRTLKYNNIYISDYQTIKELKEGVKNWMHKYNFIARRVNPLWKKPMNIYYESLQVNDENYKNQIEDEA